MTTSLYVPKPCAHADVVDARLLFLIQIQEIPQIIPRTCTKNEIQKTALYTLLFRARRASVRTTQTFATMAWSLPKSGVPRPVTGSHPVPAVKPFVLQPGFEPEVMSNESN